MEKILRFCLPCISLEPLWHLSAYPHWHTQNHSSQASVQEHTISTKAGIRKDPGRFTAPPPFFHRQACCPAALHHGPAAEKSSLIAHVVSLAGKKPKLWHRAKLNPQGLPGCKWDIFFTTLVVPEPDLFALFHLVLELRAAPAVTLKALFSSWTFFFCNFYY